MINEAYCSYEVSKLLKEKGFDEPCKSYFIDNVDYIDYFYSTEELTDLNMGVWETLRPTHQMACAWLREKHFIIVVTPVFFNVDYENSKWGYDIWADDNLEVSAEDCSKPLATYEEATEEALKYCLENLL